LPTHCHYIEEVQMNPLSPGRHQIEVDGIPQEYEVRGTGYAVCLALSGGPGIDDGYLRFPLLENELTMVYPTQVGTTALSRLPSHPDGYTLDAYARFTHAVVEHIAVPRVHLLGHSAGGFFAQRYALTHPERLAGLVLYDSMAHNTEELGEEAAARMGDFADRFADDPRTTAVLATWADSTARTTDEARTEWLRIMTPAYFADYWGREEEFASLPGLNATYVTGGSFDHRGRLREIETPTLVIVGAYDFICGPRWAREMDEELPNSTLVTLKESGHFGHIEQPEEFAAAVIEFVRGVENGNGG
jgi:proline iminopeptidase